MASVKYTHAVVCRVPQSFSDDSDSAVAEHKAFVRLLRDLGLDVIELPADESLPSCPLTEDVAVVCNGSALITHPASQARSKEVDTIRSVLKRELHLPIIEIADENARLEGGDVLFTGKEFFVGLSEFTNEAGAKAVAAAFPEYPCTPVKVSGKTHLKCLVSMAGPELLCLSATKNSQEVMNRIKREATFSYQVLTVPEDAAANVVYINGTLVHRSAEEIPESIKVFEERIDYCRKPVNVRALTKQGNGLSSCCLLFRCTKRIRCL